MNCIWLVLRDGRRSIGVVLTMERLAAVLVSGRREHLWPFFTCEGWNGGVWMWFGSLARRCLS